AIAPARLPLPEQRPLRLLQGCESGSSPSLIANSQRDVAGRSCSDERPSTTLSAIDPCSDNGCNAMVRPEPPINTLAPAPRPMPRSPEAPTYSPASAPSGRPFVGANTPQARILPALTPTSMPTVLIAPS